MKKLSLAVMMFALMAFLVACGTDNEKTDETTSGQIGEKLKVKLLKLRMNLIKSQ